MMIIVLLLDILAILLFLRDKLTPDTFLVMTSAQTGFWIGVFIMEIVAVAGGASAVGLVFVLFCLYALLLFPPEALFFDDSSFSFVGLLIYAIVKYRRAKKDGKRGQYAPTPNPAGAPFMPEAGPHPPAFMNAAPYREETTSNQNTVYNPQSVELPTQGAASTYYNQAPVKPAQMV